MNAERALDGALFFIQHSLDQGRLPTRFITDVGPPAKVVS